VDKSFTENWLPIARFERKYLISNSGKVWNLGKEIEQPQYNVDGYRNVHLKLNGKHTQIGIHRLVALHFIPNPYQYPLVNHKNGVKSHNKETNLEWADHVMNAQHALETGLRSGFMSHSEKSQLVLRVLEGELIRDLASEIGRGQESLSGMLRRHAEATNMTEAWSIEMKKRRRNAAIRNIESFNTRNT
jgi:hypothetical protein